MWSQVSNLEEDARVLELNDLDIKQWKKDLVLNSFNNYESRQILKFPISWRLLEEHIILALKRDGLYSVKFVYHLLKEETVRGNPQPSSIGIARTQRIKIYLWKVYQIVQVIK